MLSTVLALQGVLLLVMKISNQPKYQHCVQISQPKYQYCVQIFQPKYQHCVQISQPKFMYRVRKVSTFKIGFTKVWKSRH